jgi:hypothetical protein
LRLGKAKAIVALIFVVVVVIVGIQSLTPKKFPNPSQVFYVNDYARVLSAGVKEYIVTFSNELYENTKNLGDGATQIVVATFLVDSEEDIQYYRANSVDLYNQWGIGDNNMGLLIIMLYSNEQFDGYTLPKFEAFLPLVGREMAQYLNEADMGSQMTDQIFPLYLDEEIALLHFYFEAMTRIYRDAYVGLFEEFEYDMEYVEEQVEIYRGTPSSIGSQPMDLLSMVFSPLSGFFDGFGTGLITFIVIAFSGGLLFSAGGGGRSDGTSIFRRRK